MKILVLDSKHCTKGVVRIRYMGGTLTKTASIVDILKIIHELDIKQVLIDRYVHNEDIVLKLMESSVTEVSFY